MPVGSHYSYSLLSTPYSLNLLPTPYIQSLPLEVEK